MSRLARSRSPLLAILVLALIAASVGVVTVGRQRALAEAPAHWQPLLLGSPAAIRPAAPPDAGSAIDRRDLDELARLQTFASTDDASVEYWTSVPSPVRWNEILLTRIRQGKVNPVRAARALALLNAAIYDSVIAACDAKLVNPRSLPADRDARIRTAGRPDDLSSYAASDAAIAAAAQTVLTYLFPGWEDEFVARADEVERVLMITGVATRTDIEAGRSIGVAVGARAVERGRTDGSNALWRGTIPEFPGAWVPAPPFRKVQPTEPMAGTWRPWFMTSGAQFRPGPPPAFESSEWRADADEVVAVTAALSDDQVRIARSWADGSGTDTPPGHWMRIAMGLAVRDGLSKPEVARVFAYLGAAQADAFIACWDAKYTYWTGRPTGLIKGFASTIITPNFPAYISGHSTVSAASSVVLAHFFPDEAAKLRADAETAAISRLYGGIHWRVDNETGLDVGRQIGALAVARVSGDQ